MATLSPLSSFFLFFYFFLFLSCFSFSFECSGSVECDTYNTKKLSTYQPLNIIIFYLKGMFGLCFLDIYILFSKIIHISIVALLVTCLIYSSANLFIGKLYFIFSSEHAKPTTIFILWDDWQIMLHSIMSNHQSCPCEQFCC